MTRKILKILTWIGIAAWFVVVLGFVSSESKQVLCNRMDVHLSDTILHRFVTPSDVRKILEGEDMQIQGYPLDEIDTRKLESVLEKNAYIKNAEVSTDISGRLEVSVEQRVPLVRIMPEGKRGFYLDTEGKVLPLSEQYTPLILLVSGNVHDPEPGIRSFCNYLSDHPLWKEQIVQVYVNRRGEYELIPRVGAHHILMGGLDQWETKLRNLELLYKQGLSENGWNTYGTINLKYTNQVICTKR
jgi:cell division protein FtsQ